MKKSLFIVYCSLFIATASPLHAAQPVPSQGANLTSFSGNMASLQNNNWNQAIQGANHAPTADFGNCNALILRCAQPKCASGGCNDMNVAGAIVNGCVQSNATCKQYGDDLISAIAAQLVAQSNAKTAAAANEAQAQAAQAAAAQSAAQIEQMNQQMQMMQQQMAQAQAESAAQVAAALEEQKALAAQQAAAAAAAVQAAAPTEQVAAAVDRGVSADTIARNQASGQILSKLEDVSAALKSTKQAMQAVFDYAGCNSNGANCTGPKRIAAFKQKAEAFFDPFENVQDEVYDALIQAQALGVDISDIYMMLEGTCNAWGKYLCTKDATEAMIMDANGKRKQNPQCQLMKMLTNATEIQQEWLNPEEGNTAAGGGKVMLGCASDAINNSKFFKKARKQIGDVSIGDIVDTLSLDEYLDSSKKYDTNQCYYATTPYTEDELRRLVSGRYSTVSAGGVNRCAPRKWVNGACECADGIIEDYSITELDCK